MFHYDKSFKLICHMPIFQVIYKSSKNQVDSKEDIEKTSPNAGMAASMIKSYQLNHSACKELPFDILHAYLESNMRVFQESGSSKKKTLKKPLPMLEWQADWSKSSLQWFYYSLLVILEHHTPTYFPYYLRYSGNSNYSKRSNRRPSFGGHCQRTGNLI